MEAENTLSSRSIAPERAGGFAHSDKRCFNSSDLFGRAREVLIRHHGQEYRLLITKTEKLILNK
ncbi:MAG: hemin uptake protein HemP [Candidatus Omnitrophota bacterium]